jgi:hypothetical protein
MYIYMCVCVLRIISVIIIRYNFLKPLHASQLSGYIDV